MAAATYYAPPDRLGFLFGILAGVFLFLDAVLTLGSGVVSLIAHGFHAGVVLGYTARLLLEVVLGILLIFFAAIGSRRAGEYGVAGGVVVLVLSVASWVILGLGLFVALAGLFGLIAGILLVLRHR